MMGHLADHPGIVAFLIAICLSGFALGLCLMRELVRPQPISDGVRHRSIDHAGSRRHRR